MCREPVGMVAIIALIARKPKMEMISDSAVAL